MKQQVADWHYSRVGKITASRFKDVIAVSKRDGRPLKARADYMAELVTERLTGEPIALPESFAMQWGNDNESFARGAYEVMTGSLVIETEFIQHPERPYTGASPDGLIGDEGLIEIKCPVNSVRHLTCFIDGFPLEHMPQIQGQLWVTDRLWCDFVSFDPRMPQHLRTWTKRIERDEELIANIAKQVTDMHTEIEEFIAALPKAAA